MERGKSRLGKERVDMLLVDDEMDSEFLQWIMDFPRDVIPIIRFHSRDEADKYLHSLN